MPSISQEEISKYWQIFQQQKPTNGYLSQEQAMTVLQNSRLPNPELDKVWELGDIDGDGKMDFEEFCISMRLVFDRLKPGSDAIPSELPQWLVPASKRHFLDAKQALSSGSNSFSSPASLIDDDEPVLSNDFNWYISPSERREYETIYSRNSDNRGRIEFNSLDELYKTLKGVPATDVSSAWNLVNPKSEDRIDKEQCIVFLHMLNQRYKGVRLPRSVPASLRATFGKETLKYDLSGSQAEVKKPLTPTPAKPSTDDGYTSRAGQSSSTDYSSVTKDSEWEESRLRRELEDINDQLDQVEKGKHSKNANNSSAVKRELQLLLEYKQNKLRNAGSESQGDLSGARDEVMMISEQLDALREHLQQRQQQLSSLKQEVSSL